MFVVFAMDGCKCNTKVKDFGAEMGLKRVIS